MITSQKKFFFQLKTVGLEWLSTKWLRLLSLYLNNQIQCSLVFRCPSCENIPDIECSLASMVNVMFFFGSKIFTTGFFSIITLNISKAFCCFSDQINSAFFYLKFENCSVKSVYFGTYRL